MRVSAVAVLVILCSTAPLTAQGTGTLRLTVLAEGGTPLENTLVSIRRLGVSRFTNFAGIVTLGDLEIGRQAVEIRRIGFQPRDTTIEISAGGVTAAAITLARAAVRLVPIRVVARERCEHPGPPADEDDAALATAFVQLRMNASQYIALAHSYPFSYTVDRTFGYQGRDSTRHVQFIDSMLISGIPQWNYDPGNVVTYRAEGAQRGLYMNLPTVEVFADSAFIANHCFHNGGVAALEDSVPYLRVDFTAASRIRAPDIEGTIYLDALTFQVKRTILRLSRRPPIRYMQSLQVTTDFIEVAPSVPVIHRVDSRQTFDRRAPFPVLFEVQRLRQIDFHHGFPAGSNPPPDSSSSSS